MPLYEYLCRKCLSQFEMLIRSTADEEKLICPTCNSKELAKLFSTFRMGGGQKGDFSGTYTDASGVSSSCSSCSSRTCSSCR